MIRGLFLGRLAGCLHTIYMVILIMGLSYGLFHQPVQAGVYKWTDREGNVHFTDRPVNEQAEPVKFKSKLNGYQSPTTSIDSSNLPDSSGQSSTTRPVHRKREHSSIKLKPGEVIIFSTIWCGYCKKAKAYFRKKGIPFTELDIEKSASAKRQYDALGGGGVPLILIGKRKGFQRVSGFVEGSFESLYRR